MKKIIALFVLVFVVFGLISCEAGLVDRPKDLDPVDEPDNPDNPNTPDNPDNPNIPDPGVKYLTVTEAYNMALQAGSNGTSEKQYVYGTVKSISSTVYGEMYITDGKTDLYVYGVYSSDGATRYSDMTEKPYTGDVVYLYGILKTYNEKAELGASWLQKFESNQGEQDLSDYSETTIVNARKAEAGSKIIVEGVVAKITYANGMNPNGIFLVDETGSIYVYGLEVAGRVKEGQKVKVAGTKTLYILETEQDVAAIHGYQGSIQLQDSVFISASEETYDFDRSWIEESTVKNIIETPMTNNITTNIFKVKAIVKEVPGIGFTNYYIDDLDGETGSYCYSLCNGSDYAYLKEFDGKICEVYLSPLNCKATKSGTVYRFVPVAVKEIKDFSMSDEEIAKFALDYYAAKQFLAEYNSDPNLILKTTFANEYIPFDNVLVSYSSNDELVEFVTEDGVQMHIKEGNAVVKIKMEATYKEAKAEKEVKIFVNFKNIPDSISIADAIAADDGTEVVLRGIVMSGTVNQTGFYLNDGTGVIAVLTTAEIIKTISLGNEIVIKGTKTHKTTKPDQMVGQIHIADATVEVNLLGNHEYSTAPFITGLTFDEIKALIQDVNTDRTTNVYVAKCYIHKIESTHSTNYYLASTSEGNDIYLYAGSGSQYSKYSAFEGKEVTVTFAFVNWNSKTPYRACIISATDGETTILNNYNFY